MPTYEYACGSCGHEWEAEQSIKDDPLRDCPKCNAAEAKRQISRGTGFILKGGGWYSDLYSSSGGGAAAAKKDIPSVSSSDSSSGSTSSGSSTTGGSSTGGSTSGGSSGGSSST
jgi:putative FmdB family regulatory protein